MPKFGDVLGRAKKMLEDDATVMFKLDPRFPIGDVETIAARLAATGALTPGFIAPPAGLLAIPSMLYARHVDGLPTVLLPDRNVVTRMARIARDGNIGRDDPPSRLALDLMAFAQAMDIDIEPGLALHELAQVMGNDVAVDELRWFRVADQGRAAAWIDLAVGRTDRLPPLQPSPQEELPLAVPPHRWRCNYAVILKATSLELDGSLSPLRRFEMLLDWMVKEFILARPAAIFCTMFFSERAARGGLVKSFRSADRKKVLDGIRNAAWDVTYLSELTRRAQPQSYDKARCIFASGDRALTELAPLLLLDEEEASYRQQMALRFERWWGRDARPLADMLMDAILTVQDRPTPTSPPGVKDYVGFKIAEGEARIRNGI